MFCSKNVERISKYVVLSLLSLAFVASVPTDTALGPKDDEDVGIYEDDESIKHLDDFFRYTTRKRYIWEDWTDPPTETIDYRSKYTSNMDIWFYLFLFISALGFMVFLMVRCIKSNGGYDCCSAESDSSADRFTTVHPPPQRRTGFSTNVHGPPTGGNQFSGTAGETGWAVSFINSTYSGSSRSGREPGNAPTTVAERPPDYSTVTLSDLVNPARPAFPVVKKDHETPPPEYGKENPLFK